MTAVALNTLVRGRRLALRAGWWQLAAALLVALACTPWGVLHAAAGLAGGVLAAAGTACLALRGLSRGPAARVLARLLLGIGLRWAVVFAGLYVVMVRLAWPPAPIVIGLTAGLLAPLCIRPHRDS